MQAGHYIDGHDDWASTNPAVDLESEERCYDCCGKVEWYWIHDDLWASAVPPEDSKEWICVRCIGKRLGRPLVPDDLNDFFRQKEVLLHRIAIPYGYCYCGCGEKTKIATQTVRKYGYVKGEPIRYVFNHHTRKTGPRYEEQDLGYTSPCWVFLGHIGEKGYGSMRPYGSKTMRAAHIAFYEAAKGPVPAGLQLDHLCHDPDTCVGGCDCPHRACVNPDHLKPSTPQQNADNSQTRAGSKHKPGRKPKRKPTHCKHGHAFTPENTYVRTDGSWTCKECRKGMMLRAYYRRKARLASQ